MCDRGITHVDRHLLITSIQHRSLGAALVSANFAAAFSAVILVHVAGNLYNTYFDHRYAVHAKPVPYVSVCLCSQEPVYVVQLHFLALPRQLLIPHHFSNRFNCLPIRYGIDVAGSECDDRALVDGLAYPTEVLTAATLCMSLGSCLGVLALHDSASTLSMYEAKVLSLYL